MNRHVAPILALMLAGTVAAAEPFAVIDTTDWNKVENHAAPVSIASIDGKDYMNETRRTLAPGKHVIEFITTRTVKSQNLRRTRSIELEVKPCTTYWFYAVHASRYSADWELKLLRETPIEGCGQ